MITMPLACISCIHYEPQGHEFDSYSTRPNKKTPYGDCAWHESEVFCTEICPHYEKEPGTEVAKVTNRPETKQPYQSELF